MIDDEDLIYTPHALIAVHPCGEAVVWTGAGEVTHRDLDAAWRWCTAEGIQVQGVMRVLEGEGSGWGRAA